MASSNRLDSALVKDGNGELRSPLTRPSQPQLIATIHLKSDTSHVSGVWLCYSDASSVKTSPLARVLLVSAACSRKKMRYRYLMLIQLVYPISVFCLLSAFKIARLHAKLLLSPRTTLSWCLVVVYTRHNKCFIGSENSILQLGVLQTVNILQVFPHFASASFQPVSSQLWSRSTRRLHYTKIEVLYSINRQHKILNGG